MNEQQIKEALSVYPIGRWPYPRVLVGIPLERNVPHASKTFHRFLEIAAQGPVIMNQSYTRTDLARNRFAMKLLESQFTHLLMLDLDHVHPVDIVQRLARWVLADPGRLVVGGLNFRRSEPYEPCCFVRDKNGLLASPAKWTPGLMRVDYLGTGSIMIHRKVFEMLEPPWFFNIYDDELRWADTWPGEDIGFNQKCTDAGIELFVDTSTTSPHLTDGLVTESTFNNYLQKHKDQYYAVEDGVYVQGEKDVQSS